VRARRSTAPPLSAPIALAALASAALGALAAGGCRGNSSPPDPLAAPASPQASAIPAPLANVPTMIPSAPSPLLSPDAGPPPAPMRADQPVPPDPAGRELAGYTLEASLRAADLPPLAKGGEISGAGMEAARKKTEPRLTIDLSAARARLTIASAGFVLPEGSEIRARSDRYGHLVILAEGVAASSTYRIAPPGAMRALLGERRLDVAPLSPAEIGAAAEGARRLGYRTRKVDVGTRAGRATFEIGRVTDAGDGGALVCRALLDLLGALHATPLCGADDVPLRVEIRWRDERPALVFEATSIVRRLDLPAAILAAPGPGLAFARGPLPGPTSEIFLGPSELAALRSGPQDIAAHAAGAAAGDVHARLTLVNETDELRYAWLDGVPIAWVGPGSRAETSALYRGRYAVEWRTFLGDAPHAPRTASLPATVEVAPPADAGP